MRSIKTKLITCFIGLLSFSAASLADVQLSGEFMQGGLIVGKTAPQSKVYFDEKLLPITKTGHFVFGFSRDDKESHQLLVVEPDGQEFVQVITPKAQDYKIQRVEGIPKKIMNPNKADKERISKDAEQVWVTRDTQSLRNDFVKGFKAPATGVVTGVYGSQRFYNGKAGRPHYGIDYAGKTGTPVYAPASGKVTMWVPDMFYSGGTMIIDHGHGVTSTFLHLSASYVIVGQEVNQGDKVAAIGASGRATGPHLDWRVNWGHVKLDPALALKVLK